MNEAVKKPGLVIFVAILHFFSVALFSFLALFCVVAMLFGAAWGIDDYFAQQMSQMSSRANFSYGLTLIFGVALVVFLVFAAYFAFLAIGLLKGKKIAWYLQVAFSTLGLLSAPLGFLWSMALLPLGAALNVVILIFFFQPRIRQFFNV